MEKRMKKVKVCLAAPIPPPYGGIANWTKVLLSSLQKKKEEVACTVVDLSPKKRVTEKTSLLRRALIGGKGLFRAVRETKKALKEGDFTALHLTSSGSLGLIRDLVILNYAKKKKVKSVYHLHYGRITEICQRKGREFRRLLSSLTAATKIVVIDKKTEETLREMGFSEKTVYIPNGIDTESLPVRKNERKNILTYIGWVIPKKGIEELITAWKGLSASEKKDWKLQIIGPYDKDYIERFQSEQRTDIIFTGELPHEKALAVLNEGKGFVLPSHTEGFPYSVLEAMALGVRIIGTEVGNIPEMLKGTEGILIPKQDENALREAVRSLIQSENGFDPSAVRKVTEEYEITKVTERYLKLWKEG